MSGQPGSIGSIVKPTSFEAAIAAELREMRRQITELKTARTLAASTLGDSGSLVVAGGEFQVQDTSANIVSRIGTDPSTGFVGLRTLRSSGGLMFGSMPVGFLGLTFTSIYDAGGNSVVSDDPVYGGMLRPYLPVPMYDNTAITNITTSASYVTLQTGYCIRSHGAVVWQVTVLSSSAGTTGNVRLIDASSNVVATIAVPANATTATSISATTWPAATWTVNDAQFLSVQAQRTGGTGNIGVRTTGLYLVGSS